MTSGNGLFWLTKKSGAFVGDPESCLLTGLQRCFKSKKPGLNFMTRTSPWLDRWSNIYWGDGHERVPIDICLNLNKVEEKILTKKNGILCNN